MTSILIAIKYEDIRPWSLNEFIQMLAPVGNFTVAQICDQERQMMQVLGWQASFTTFYDWIERLVQKIGLLMQNENKEDLTYISQTAMFMA